jgi:DNA polymerase-3 subunit epsilon
MVRIRSGRLRRGNGDADGVAYLDAHVASRRTHWREARWCALDLELTGLDPRSDEIISFGVIPIEEGRLQLRGAVHQLIKPERRIRDEAIRIHGIRAADLERAPGLDEALDILLRSITGRILVVHTAVVERTFLGRALQERGLRPRGPMVDTEVLGRLWLFERDGHLKRRLPLGELARALGLPAEHPHDALADALTTAQVFIALCTHLDTLHPETVGSLAHANRRIDAVRSLQAGVGLAG